MKKRGSKPKLYAWLKKFKEAVFSKKTLKVLVFLFLLGVISVAGLFIYYMKDLPDPEKITSSMPVARMFLWEFSPMTQRRASTRLDLPQPFGPTTPVRPGSIRKSVGSTKVLKPAMRRRVSFMDAPSRPAPRGQGNGAYSPKRGLMTFSSSSIDMFPE